MPGYIFNIQRFCTYDGPGIRTTVFLKGCPLACWWCHNPESQQRGPQVTFTPKKCLQCRMCIAACTSGALTVASDSSFLNLHEEICQQCGACQLACPTEALMLIGREVVSEEVLAEVMKDLAFYEESGGGVTFSGGEPLAQPDFLVELLLASRAHRLHTTIDTSGYAPSYLFQTIAPLTDLFLYDIKHTDSHRHQQLTGVSNDLIMANLRLLAKARSKIHLRLPIIPGCTDDMDNLLKTRGLALELGISIIHLLPYHAIGSGKYQALGLRSKLPGIIPPSDERLRCLAEHLKHPDLEIRIGG